MASSATAGEGRTPLHHTRRRREGAGEEDGQDEDEKTPKARTQGGEREDEGDEEYKAGAGDGGSDTGEVVPWMSTPARPRTSDASQHQEVRRQPAPAFDAFRSLKASTASATSLGSLHRKLGRSSSSSLLLDASLPAPSDSADDEEDFDDEFQTLDGSRSVRGASTEETTVRKGSTRRGEGGGSEASSTLVNSDDRASADDPLARRDSASSVAALGIKRAVSPAVKSPARRARMPVSAFEVPVDLTLRPRPGSSSYPSPTMTASSTLGGHIPLPSTMPGSHPSFRLETPGPANASVIDPVQKSPISATSDQTARALRRRRSTSPLRAGSPATTNSAPYLASGKGKAVAHLERGGEEEQEEEEEESPPIRPQRKGRMPLTDRITALVDSMSSTVSATPSLPSLSSSALGRRLRQKSATPAQAALEETESSGAGAARVALLFERLSAPLGDATPQRPRAAASAPATAPASARSGRARIDEAPRSESRLGARRADGRFDVRTRRADVEESRATPAREDRGGRLEPSRPTVPPSATPTKGLPMGTSHLPRSTWRATYKLKSQERNLSDDEAPSISRSRGPVWRDQDQEPRRTPATPARVARPDRELSQTPAVAGAYPRTPAPAAALRTVATAAGKGKAKAEGTPRKGADAESAWTAVTGKKLPTPVWADFSSSGNEPPATQQPPAGPSSSAEESPLEPQLRRGDLNARLAHFSSVAGTPHAPGHLWSVSSPSTPIPATTPSRETPRSQDNRRLAASSATPPTPRPPGHFAMAPTPPTPAPISRPELWLAESRPDDHESADEEEEATRRDRRTSTPPRPAKVRFDDVDASDRSFSTGHATSFREAEGEHEEEDTTKESIAEARVTSLLEDLADAVKDLKSEPGHLQELVDASFSLPAPQASSPHRAILTALARSSSTTASDRAQILSRLRSSDQTDRELSLRVDDIRKSVEGMGGRLADAVREGFREEGGKRKRWLVTVVLAEAAVVWLMLTFASARASYLFQTVYFDPFNAVLYDPLPASSSYLAAALLPSSPGPTSVFAALPPTSPGLASLMFDVVGATARWFAGWRLLATTNPAAGANRIFVPT